MGGGGDKHEVRSMCLGTFQKPPEKPHLLTEVTCEGFLPCPASQDHLPKELLHRNLCLRSASGGTQAQTPSFWRSPLRPRWGADDRRRSEAVEGDVGQAFPAKNLISQRLRTAQATSTFKLQKRKRKKYRHRATSIAADFRYPGLSEAR